MPKVEFTTPLGLHIVVDEDRYREDGVDSIHAEVLIAAKATPTEWKHRLYGPGGHLWRCEFDLEFYRQLTPSEMEPDYNDYLEPDPRRAPGTAPPE